MKCKNNLFQRVLRSILISGWISILFLFGVRASIVQAQGGGDTGLVAYWKMEEGSGTTVVDSAGYGHDLFLASNSSTPQWLTDVPPLTGGNGHSLAFDGVDDYAYAYSLAETAGSGQLTVEAWVKFDGSAVASHQGFATASEPDNAQWALTTANDSPLPNELQVFIPNSNTYTYWGYTVGANLQPNQWYHIAFVFDGSAATDVNRLRIYVNGATYPLNFSSSASALTNTHPTIRLGTNGFHGKLDEVRIYTVARSSTDIANDAVGQVAPTQPPPPPTPAPPPVPGDPVAYWKMEEGSGTTVVDSAGYGHDLFLASNSSTPQWSTDVPPLTGGNGHSLAFDGVDDYAYAYSLAETAGSAQLTVEAWVKFDGSAVASHQGFATASEPDNAQWGLSTAHNSPLPNELQVFIPNSNTYTYWGYTVGANLQPNQWYHIAFVFDGSAATDVNRLRIYVNGATYPLNFSSSASALTNTHPTIRLGTNGFHGKLDEVRIYTVARSSTDIANDAVGQVAPTQPPPPPTPAPPPVPGDPVAYWKMEEGSGTTVVDSAGHGYNLSLASNSSTPQWSTDVPPLTGGNGHSLAFDGVDDYAYAYPLAETAGSGQLTVEAWVKFDGSTVASHQGFATAAEASNEQWVLTTAHNTLPNELQVFVAGGGGNNWGYTVGTNLQPNQWYHIAFVFDGSGATVADRLKVYVNGAAYPMNFSAIPSTLTNTFPTIRLGTGFHGKLDEVRIYTVARSSTDIANDAAGQTASPQPPPVTTATTNPSPNAQGVYPGPVTVTLAATATPGFTVAATYYTIDGGAIETYTSPFVVSADGTHTVEYWSVDNTGMAEQHRTLTVQIAALHITTDSPLPNGTAGVAYTTQLAATGGTPPYAWSVALPPGLTLNEATGEISGSPSTAGSFNFTLQVTDHAGAVTTKPFALTIQALFTDVGVSVTDLQFAPAIAVPGQPVTIKAQVHNWGLSDATNVRVNFVDFGAVLHQTTISSLPAGTATEVTFATTYAAANLHLISIQVDPDNVIAELHEDNNEASKVLQVGQLDLSQATMVIQAAAATTCQGQVVSVNGQVFYDFSQVPGTNDYPVQGGSVTLTLLDPVTNNPIGVFSGVHTDVDGKFSQAVLAPASDGTYPVRVAVTDQTIMRQIQTTLTVSGSCPVPPPIPSPPPPEPSPTPGPPPPNGPPTKDVYVRAEDIYFTNNHPAPGETIQVVAYIHYYGSDPAQNIPVTLYDILPVNGALARVVIGTAQVSFQSGGSGATSVIVPWTANPAGAHVIQVVVAPPFDQFTQNDKATRLLIVGDLPQLEIHKSLAVLLDADGDGKASPGDRLQYTISYRNHGTAEATNAVLLDDYDEGLLATPMQISAGGAVGNGAITWPLGTLAAGASGSVTYQVDILPKAQFPPGRTKITNFALLTADQSPAVADAVEVEVSVNRAPMLGVEQAQVTKDEGQAATNRGAVSDPDGDAVTLSASVGAVVNNGNGTWSWSFTTSDGPPQSQTVTITADDGHGGASQISFSLVVNNVAPTVGAISAPVNPQPAGTVLNTSAPFTDPGTGDTHTAVWDWEGATSAGTVNETNGSGTASGNHSYPTPGVYTLKLTVTDDDGGSGQAFFQYVVIYDPTGGFVTGAGWISSPAGAYVANPALTGRANFGFNAKYKKGQSVPDGSTEFQFQVANLSFQSTSYEWLVVAGAGAKFKGVGTINGSGNYGFMLTATDGQVSGGGGVDKFRMKIWDKNHGDVVVYDNQIGENDDSYAGTVLSGGTVVIHSSGNGNNANAATADDGTTAQLNRIFLPVVQR